MSIIDVIKKGVRAMYAACFPHKKLSGPRKERRPKLGDYIMLSYH